jgi:hypothetical protein
MPRQIWEDCQSSLLYFFAKEVEIKLLQVGIPYLPQLQFIFNMKIVTKLLALFFAGTVGLYFNYRYCNDNIVLNFLFGTVWLIVLEEFLFYMFIIECDEDLYNSF